MKVELLEKIFLKCNDKIFRISNIPWFDETLIINNIITSMKRRMDVKGFQELFKYDDLSPIEQELLIQLVEEGYILDPENLNDYLVITEYGMLFLNYAKCNNVAEEQMVESIYELLKEINNENLRRRCTGVFSNEMSSKESIVALFLLLNGAISKDTALKLTKNANGAYLYGVEILTELNRIYRSMSNDVEELISTERELRNVIGRNGKNGRLAKIIPEYRIESNSLWFELSDGKDKLPEIKRIIDTLLLGFEDIQKKEQIDRLVVLIEDYLICNPIEPYITQELFGMINSMDHLFSLHLVAKDLQRWGSEQQYLYELKNPENKRSIDLRVHKNIIHDAIMNIFPNAISIDVYEDYFMFVLKEPASNMKLRILGKQIVKNDNELNQLKKDCGYSTQLFHRKL